MPDIFRYGPYPSNFTEVHPAQGERTRGTIAMIHGGWWRARHDLHQMNRLSEALAADGWRVGNIEFRRTGADWDDAGGWPATYDDITTAIGKRAPVPDGLPTIAVGHSAGGHLALLAAAAGLVDAVVALAPITDLPRSHREQLGEGATELFMGAVPERAPDAYASASPITRLPIGRPQLIVHGTEDVRVPLDHSRDYVSRARSLGESVEFIEVPAADHFAVIDVEQAWWGVAHQWINAVLPAERGRGPA